MAERPVAPCRAQGHIEQWFRHAALVRGPLLGDKRLVSAINLLHSPWHAMLDFALPPRCCGCGVIVDALHTFCIDCWRSIDFIQGGCESCGLPLLATDIRKCAACLAKPPRIDRTRAAVAYDDVTRSLALRLKYGRKVGLAKTMAHYMAPLLGRDLPHACLTPVPLHRRRLWQRGFNQAGLIASELSRRSGLSVEHLLVRTKRTPPLKGLSRRERRRAVAGAFAVRNRANLEGRTVVLVDDVLTTGSTAEGCARALLRAGAERVEFISWARVLRPSQLDV